MKTKEIAFTLPFAAVLYEFCFFRGAWKRRLLCLLPLLATIPIVPLSVLATGQTSGRSTGDLLSDMGQQALVHGKLSQFDYLFTQFRVIVTYLRLLVLPVNQNLDYDYPVYTSFFTPQVFLSFLLLAAIFALAMYLFWRNRPASFHAPLLHATSGNACVAPTQPLTRSFDPTVRLIAFGIFWFFVTLAVESSLISIADVIVEHRLYLPSVGAAAAFATAFFLAARRSPLPVGSKLLVPVAALLVLVLGFATFQRNHVWGDAIRLWQDVVAKSPEKVRPYNNLGVALTNAGRLPEAIEVLSRAIEMDPSHPHAYNNLGRVFILSDRSEDALPVLRMAIRLDLDYDDAYINLAAALNQTRRFRETIALLEPNLSLLGERVETHYHLGVANALLGNREAAKRKLAIVSRVNADLAADLIRLLGRNAH
jgi:tetratricopeptide (TPR) repeat protein